jgi:hypothetical protein
MFETRESSERRQSGLGAMTVESDIMDETGAT